MAEAKKVDVFAAIKTEEEKFTECDFSDYDQIVELYPRYMREQHKLRKSGVKNIPKNVNIENFCLKTPFGDQTLLVDTELVLEPNRRTCLYGNNSTGKTLLFHYMNHGKIKDFPLHIHVHHCQELEQHELGDTVINTVVNSHPLRNILIRVEAKIRELIAAAPAKETLDKLQANLDQVVISMNGIQGYTGLERAQKMLRVLGFDEIGQARLVSALSGGLRMRVALCMAFFIDPELLLLDEPTNHLDFPSVLWLENRLRSYRSAFLVVSHDRELLNNVVSSVLLLQDKKIKYYTCGFKDFEVKKAKEDADASKEIEKFLAKNANADPSSLLGRQKHEKKAWLERYLAHQIAMAGKFTFPKPVELENKENLPVEQISLINLKDVTFSYNVALGVWIFKEPVSFNVTASTRCGVMGPNGAGKSTILKLLTGKITAVTGSVTPHPKYRLAYFGQHSTAELDLELTAAEFMIKMFPKMNPANLRAHLNKTGISDSVAETRMSGLSYSQRSCVIFSKLTYVCPHLLILDEPTNFLDLESVDSLIMACNKYKGALLLVSHNRDFLRKCATSYLSIVPGRFEFFDNIKDAERATYTFIAEMESGGHVDKNAISAGIASGGGVAHLKTGEESKGPAGGAAAASAAAAPSPYTVGEQITAKWTDGKFYDAKILKIDGPKHTIEYAVGGKAIVTAANMKKKEAAAAPATKEAAAAPAKKK